MMQIGFRKHARAALLALGTLVALVGCTAQDSEAQNLPKLTGGEWYIEDIAGGGIIDNTVPSLSFAADGSLGGNMTCNRLIANYKADGASLSISAVGLTRMMCPEALMNQEDKLVNLLPKVKSYTGTKTGALVLRTTSGKTITARRR